VEAQGIQDIEEYIKTHYPHISRTQDKHIDDL